MALLGGASLQQAQSMARHAIINTTLVCSRNLDCVSQVGEFAVDRMLGESRARRVTFVNSHEI